MFTKGYDVQFDDVTDYVMNLIPQEEINSGRRENVLCFLEKQCVK